MLLDLGSSSSRSHRWCPVTGFLHQAYINRGFVYFAITLISNWKEKVRAVKRLLENGTSVFLILWGDHCPPFIDPDRLRAAKRIERRRRWPRRPWQPRRTWRGRSARECSDGAGSADLRHAFSRSIRHARIAGSSSRQQRSRRCSP